MNIEDSRIRMADSVHWLGFVDVGGNVNKNQQYVYAARAAAQVEYRQKKHFFLSISQYNLLKTEGKNILNDGMQHLRYNYALQPFLNIEIFSQIQYNERISLQQRAIAGAGLRYRLWKLKEGRAYVGTAYMFEKTNWLGDSERRNDHRLTAYFSMNHAVKDKFRVATTFYFQPVLTNWHNNRIAGVASGQLFFTKKLSARTVFSINYDNDTRLPTAIPNLVFQWINGIRFDF